MDNKYTPIAFIHNILMIKIKLLSVNYIISLFSTVCDLMVAIIGSTNTRPCVSNNDNQHG